MLVMSWVVAVWVKSGWVNNQNLWVGSSGKVCAIRRALASILYHFRDIASYLSKDADFCIVYLHLASHCGWLQGNFIKTFGGFGVRKL